MHGLAFPAGTPIRQSHEDAHRKPAEKNVIRDVFLKGINNLLQRAVEYMVMVMRMLET